MNLPSYQKQQENWTKYRAAVFRKQMSSIAGLFSLKEGKQIISMIASAFLLEIISRQQCRKGQSNQSTVVSSIEETEVRTQEDQGSSNLALKNPGAKSQLLPTSLHHKIFIPKITLIFLLLYWF